MDTILIEDISFIVNDLLSLNNCIIKYKIKYILENLLENN